MFFSWICVKWSSNCQHGIKWVNMYYGWQWYTLGKMPKRIGSNYDLRIVMWWSANDWSMSHKWALVTLLTDMSATWYGKLQLLLQLPCGLHTIIWLLFIVTFFFLDTYLLLLITRNRVNNPWEVIAIDSQFLRQFTDLKTTGLGS